MKANPILFSGEMVRAILDGRKTQTRRVVKPQPIWGDAKFSTTVCSSDSSRAGKHRWVVMKDQHTVDEARSSAHFLCPYGAPGDLLWVREQFCPEHSAFMQPTGNVFYKATDGEELPYSHKWKPSIHMPRWASRITLEITDIRAHRLQDITREDAEAEGVKWNGRSGLAACPWMESTPIAAFKQLWRDINGQQSWSKNPWVWAITFTPHFVNVDEFINQTPEAPIPPVTVC